MCPSSLKEFTEYKADDECHLTINNSMTTLEERQAENYTLVLPLFDYSVPTLCNLFYQTSQDLVNSVAVPNLNASQVGNNLHLVIDQTNDFKDMATFYIWGSKTSS